MRNPYTQIVRCYSRRWILWVPAWAFVFVLLLSLLGRPRDHIEMTFVVVQFMMLGILFQAITTVALEQFANARSKLLPGFAKPHLCVAGALAVVLCAFSAVAIASTSAASWLPTAAVVFAACALATWGTTRWTPMLFVVYGAVFLQYGAAGEMLKGFLRGDVRIAAVVVLGLSLAALVWLGIRLAHLDEEQPEYVKARRQRAWNYGQQSGEQAGYAGWEGTGSFWTRVSFSRHDRIFERSLAVPISTWGQDIQRLRAAVTTPSWGIIAAFGVVYLWVVGRLTPAGRAFVPLSGLFLLLGLILYSNTWRKAIVREAGRPTTRRQLLRKVGATLWIEYSKAWCAWIIMAALVYALESPSFVWGWDNFVFCVFLFCALLPTFGIAAWLALLVRTNMVWLIIFMGTFVGAFMGVTVSAQAARHHPLMETWLIAACICVVVGVPLVWSAYRAWLEADWD